jgi:hypothetical protein
MLSLWALLLARETGFQVHGRLSLRMKLDVNGVKNRT